MNCVHLWKRCVTIRAPLKASQRFIRNIIFFHTFLFLKSARSSRFYQVISTNWSEILHLRQLSIWRLIVFKKRCGIHISEKHWIRPRIRSGHWRGLWGSSLLIGMIELAFLCFPTSLPFIHFRWLLFAIFANSHYDILAHVCLVISWSRKFDYEI